MKLFDSHCHLHFPEFDQDRDAVLERMQERQMGAVLIGTDLATSKDALELARPHDFLWASVGLHPNEKEERIDISIHLEALAKDPKVVAIGECGLDYFRSGGSGEERAAQKEKFLAQLQLAQKLQKALVIHCRDAHEDMLALLTEQGPTLLCPIIMHFFTGSGELAERYLDLGCYLSFPGPITYTDMYDESIRVCPMDKMLIETDSPFAAPVPFRGKRNEPVYVEHVAAKIAQVKGLLSEEIASRTTNNASQVFQIAL